MGGVLKVVKIVSDVSTNSYSVVDQEYTPTETDLTNNRNLGATINTYLANQSLVKLTLLEIETTTGTVYYTDGPFDIDHNGNTYLAQGNFLSVTDIEENTDLVITNCVLNISALDSANLSKFAISGNINKTITVSTAYLDPTDNSIVGTPIINFKGNIVGYSVSDARNTATISLEVASLFANFERVGGRRTNEANFRREHPNDRTMEFAHQTIEDILWGKV